MLPVKGRICFFSCFVTLLMQMGVAAELQIGEGDLHHMSTSNIWLNRRRSASCKGTVRSNHCDIGPKKKTSGSDKKLSDHGDASKKKRICLCAPTTHAGSFKCRLHRATDTANAANAHKPLASSSMKCSSTGKTSFSSRNLDVQPLPRLSRFGRAVVAAAYANASGSRSISTALQNNQVPYQEAAD